MRQNGLWCIGRSAAPAWFFHSLVAPTRSQMTTDPLRSRFGVADPCRRCPLAPRDHRTTVGASVPPTGHQPDALAPECQTNQERDRDPCSSKFSTIGILYAPSCREQRALDPTDSRCYESHEGDI